MSQRLTISSTLKFVASKFNMTEHDLKAKDRRKNIVLPRSIAIWIASKNGVGSLSKIAWYMDFDHTTIMHARNKIERMIQNDVTFRQHVLSMEADFLANLDRPSVPAISKPHLDAKEAERGAEVRPVSTVDSGS